MDVHRTTGALVIALCAVNPALARAQNLAQDLSPFVPPPCVAGQEMFTDVPASNPFCPWIEQLVRDHITGGCGPQLYCPTSSVTRAQMAVFLELAMRGTDTWTVDAGLLDGMDSTDFVSAVNAGTGLSGGGSGGSVTIALADSYRLPQTCTGGQHPEWTGTAWTCGNPGTGTVTSVGTGAGLTGGPITGAGTISVAPGGITSAMVADGAIGSADVADGSIGAADVASAQVQLRVAPPCAAGQFVRAINVDGTPVCATDADSGGTVTSVGSGAGLTGGPITGTGTLSVAAGGITGAMIAAGSVGTAHVADGSIGTADIADGSISAADVASSQIQLRVSQACSTGQFMRSVNADGTVTCAGDAAHNHFGQNWSGSAAEPGLFVVNGLGTGLSGLTTSTGGTGVRGDATASTGLTTGVLGFSSSTAGIGVQGVANATTGTTYGVSGINNSASGTGVRGEALATTGTASGVYGHSSSSSGTGVHGEAVATTGGTYGVRGITASNAGWGVRGTATAATGNTIGVHGDTNSTSGRGVLGAALAPTGLTTGVHGLNVSTSGRGVLGEATATSGTTWGVYGLTSSPSGRAVEGASQATTGPNVGVMGSSQSTGGYGVAGFALAASGSTWGVAGSSSSTSGYGVAGSATATSGTNYGVFGSTNSPAGYGGFFVGRVQVTSDLLVNGNLLVSGVKNFRIDHPLDPANKYLVHAAVESSEVLNMYSGTVVLDANGKATVQLPAWFEALNRDFRYQLTCVGGYAPVYIASKIRDGRFGIAGGTPGLEVSWQVVGTRSDAHALAHPMVVEEEKPADERGTYLDPEAHGQPADLRRDRTIMSALPNQ